MAPAIALFTRDLRVHDHPALTAAARAENIVPVFVLDETILASRFAAPNRTQFLFDSLVDLHASLERLGAGLVVRRGDWVTETLGLAEACAATEIHVSADVSAYSRARIARLEAAGRAAGVAVVRHPGITAVPADALAPTGGDHFQVFTPYWRRWQDQPKRAVLAPPTRLSFPDGFRVAPLPDRDTVVTGPVSPELVPGGETEARAGLNRWVRAGLAGYGDAHDDLPGDATSRISAALHFGCLSALEVVTKLAGRPGAEPFVRQLCWRDFFHQVLAARPDAAWHDYKDRGDHWNEDDVGFAAWRDGRTGYPVVDAAMRQLAREGFVHNRARMIAASFLTKDLAIDWRRGARHFLDLLVDGDLASNNLNWQWTAGTGTDTNPHRIFNPTVQGKRFDPDGEYVCRYVPELRDVPGGAVHDLGPLERAGRGYPEPIVDHHEAIAEYRARRSG